MLDPVTRNVSAYFVDEKLCLGLRHACLDSIAALRAGVKICRPYVFAKRSPGKRPAHFFCLSHSVIPTIRNFCNGLCGHSLPGLDPLLRKRASSHWS